MDLEHPQITQTLRTGYPTNEELARDNEPIENNSCDEYITNEGDVEMENVRKFTVHEVLESDAVVRISFHRCKDLQSAYNKLKPYRHLGKINRHQAGDTVWLHVNYQNIEVTAFL